MTKRFAARAMALAILMTAAAIPAFAETHATKPKHPVAVPTPALPNAPLHTEFVVEVNARGQVVRVKSGKSCKNLTFNAQTYGNVLQMWIRHPDGSAEVGLYRVNYDYNPKTKKVRRSIALIRAGGNWANAKGAATDMIDTADREAEQARKARSGKNLPPLNAILGTPSPHP